MRNRVRECRMLDGQHERDQQQGEELAQVHGFSGNSRHSVALARGNSQVPLLAWSGHGRRGSRGPRSWLILWRKPN
jgi:hypothetical protein